MNCSECGLPESADLHDPKNWNVESNGHPFDESSNELAASGPVPERQADDRITFLPIEDDEQNGPRRIEGRK